MPMPHIIKDGEAIRTLGASAGFANWLEGGINYITAVNRVGHGHIEASLGNSVGNKRALTINLTMTGWRALFEAVSQVAAGVIAPPNSVTGRLTAAQIHYAADIVERMSADTGAYSPSRYEWSADTMRNEATASYQTDTVILGQAEVTA